MPVKYWLLSLTLLFTVCFQEAAAQKKWSYIEKADIVSSDTIKKGRNTLIFINTDPDFNPAVKKRLIDVFFYAYPRQIKQYNKKAIDKVIFIIDRSYDGVAAAGEGIVRFNPEWFRKNPNDIDVVTHEVMHIVQNYPDNAGPWWITEGIADYVRFTMGLHNPEANWKLPDYSEKQSYSNSYRITARFFYWLEKNYDKRMVKKLDHAMRTKTYHDSFWKAVTGKSIDDLWQEYGSKPAI